MRHHQKDSARGFSAGLPLGAPARLRGFGRSVVGLAAAVGLVLAGCSSPKTPQVSVTVEPAGAHCAHGGVRLQVGSDTPTFVCNAPGQTDTTTTLTSGPNPSTFGQSTTLTATVTAKEGTPTGVVTFLDGASPLGTSALDATGKATLATSALAAGTHNLAAVYFDGQGAFASSTSVAVAQIVHPAATTVTLTSSAAQSDFGAPVVFTAQVSPVAPGAGTPTGVVTFKDGDNVLGSALLDATGAATFTGAVASAGAASVIAVYGGDSDFTGSTSSAVTETVGPAATTTLLTSDTEPATYGQTVTFTATVAAAPGAWGVPTGTVSFLDASTQLSQATLDANGSATFTTSSLVPGLHTIIAVYAGDDNFHGSVSNAVPEVSTPAATTTTLSTDSGTSVFGQAITLTAVVAGATSDLAPATGTVTFQEGPDVLGTATVDASGTATFSTSSLAVGSHELTAAYAGDTDYAPSTSGSVTQTVSPAATTTVVTADLNPSSPGFEVTFTAHVTANAPGAGMPTGTVTLLDGTTTLGTSPLANGAATFATATLHAGTQDIAAAYGGDASFTASTSATLSEQVQPPGTTTVTVTSSVNPSVYGQPITFVAQVDPSATTGTVTLTLQDTGTIIGSGVLDGTTGKVTVDTSGLASPLATGTNVIVATFGGNATTGPAAGTLAQTVGQASTTVTLSSSKNPSTFGDSVSFTAKVSATAPGAGTPTGSVTFHDAKGAIDMTVNLDQTGSATMTTSALDASTHSMTASYGGDLDFTASESSVVPQQVAPAASTTTLTANPNPSKYGNPVTFTVKVAPPSGLPVPQGDVILVDGTTALGTEALDQTGAATFSLSSLDASTHPMTAAYNQDGVDPDYAPSTSAVVSEAVQMGSTPSTVTLTVSPNRPFYGQSVTFTATVTGNGSITPTGTVTFQNGPTTVATVPLSGGTATYVVSNLQAAPNPFAALYSGDGTYRPLRSAMVDPEVRADPTVVNLTATPSPAQVGQPVAVTVRVSVPPMAPSPSNAIPTGTASLTVDSNAPRTLTLDASGQATFSLTGLTAGTHGLFASFTPANNNFSVPSDVLTQLVVKQAALTLTPNGPLHLAEQGTVTLSATLTDSTSPATDTIDWSLNPGAVGKLQVGATTRTSTSVTSVATYTAPTFVGLPDAVTATANGATATDTIKTDPPLANQPPLPTTGITRLDRVADFAIFGANLDSNASGANEMLLAPSSARANFDGSGGNGGTDHAMFHDSTGLDPDVDMNLRKVTASGNLDDDVQDETVVVAWNPGTSSTPGSGPRITILDPFVAADGTVTAQVRKPLARTSNGTAVPFLGPAGWFDFDVTLADLDGDGYDEIIVTGTNDAHLDQPSEVSTAPGMVWVFDDLMHQAPNCPAGETCLKLLAQATLTGDLDGTNQPQGALIARVAAGSMSKDGSKQVVVAWIDGHDWANAWTGCGANCTGIPQAHYQIFGYGADTLTPIGNIQRTYYDSKKPQTAFLAMASSLRTANVLGVSLVDLDGSGVQDLVLGSWNTGYTANGLSTWVRLEARGNLDSVTSTTDAAALPMLAVASSPQVVPTPSGSSPNVGVSVNHPPSRWLQPSWIYPPSKDASGATRTPQIFAGDSLATWGPDGSTPPQMTFQWSSNPWAMALPVDYFETLKGTGNPTIDQKDDFYLGQSYLDVRAGDVNGDGQDDLIVLRATGEIDAYGWMCQVAPGPVPCQWTWNPQPFYSYAGTPFNVNAVLSPAAWDDDSTTVEYANQHKIVYGSNKVIALLAAPPAVDPTLTDPAGDPIQNNGNNTFTIFGQMSGITSGSSVTAGIHAGIEVGVDIDESSGLLVNMKDFEFREALTVEAEATFTQEWSHDTTFTVEYGQGIGSDGVVFSTVPYDQYGYTIVSDLDRSRVGQTFYINVPQKPQVLFVDRDFFNHVANANSFQITSDLLRDKPYDMTSYPKCTDFPTAPTSSTSPMDLGNGIQVYSTIQPMGEMPEASQPSPGYPPQWSGGNTAGSYTTETLDEGQSTSQTWGGSLTVDLAAEVQIGVVVLGANAGFSIGGDQTTSFEQGVSFSGTAGSILDDYVSQYEYDFRLFGYKQTLSTSPGGDAFQSFFVVNYGVDALGSEYSPQATSASCVY